MKSGKWKVESGNQSGKWQVEGGRRSHFAFPLSHFPFPARSAFTLTELLVVITIIAILASLITAGAINALNASKRAAITLEINQLGDAIERFKNETGGAYPPNVMNDNSNNYAGTSVYSLAINDFERSFRKAFPRHNEPQGLLWRLAGSTNLPSGDTSGATVVEEGMNGAEALYFWLGGFSSDPVYPISGPGGPSFADVNQPSGLDPADEILENRARLYEFDLTRLAPRTTEGVFNGRWLTYTVNINGGPQLRRINLWTYSPKGVQSSFAYFDASRHDPINYDLDLSGALGSGIFAVKKLREGFSGTSTPTVADIHFVNKGKFQILHAGLDDAWGNLLPFSIASASSATDASGVMLFPDGPFTGDIADTLTNFTGGTLESAQE